jgi:hypothetical protein
MIVSYGILFMPPLVVVDIFVCISLQLYMYEGIDKVMSIHTLVLDGSVSVLQPKDIRIFVVIRYATIEIYFNSYSFNSSQK